MNHFRRILEGKTEHSGAKKGKGAFWGPKKDAKKTSNKQRRSDGKKAAMDEALTKDDKEFAISFAQNVWDEAGENFMDAMKQAPPGTDEDAVWKLFKTTLKKIIK